MSIVVKLIVGELQLVEGDELAHPVAARSRGVRVDVDAWRGYRVRFARYNPA